MEEPLTQEDFCVMDERIQEKLHEIMSKEEMIEQLKFWKAPSIPVRANADETQVEFYEYLMKKNRLFCTFMDNVLEPVYGNKKQVASFLNYIGASRIATLWDITCHYYTQGSNQNSAWKVKSQGKVA